MKLRYGIGLLSIILALSGSAVAAPAGGAIDSQQFISQSVSVNAIQPATPLLAASDGRLFVFSPRQLRWYAYKNGRLIKSGAASGGANYCRDVGRACRTPRGTFYISRMGGPNCRSGRYPRPRGGAWMGYCMFFSKHYAIHASNNVPKRNASHGCIRVKPAAAKWLRYNFMRPGTRVVVKSY